MSIARLVSVKRQYKEDEYKTTSSFRSDDLAHLSLLCARLFLRRRAGHAAIRGVLTGNGPPLPLSGGGFNAFPLRSFLSAPPFCRDAGWAAHQTSRPHFPAVMLAHRDISVAVENPTSKL